MSLLSHSSHANTKINTHCLRFERERERQVDPFLIHLLDFFVGTDFVKTAAALTKSVL